jgi:hypothetical protein
LTIGNDLNRLTLVAAYVKLTTPPPPPPPTTTTTTTTRTTTTTMYLSGVVDQVIQRDGKVAT